MRELVAMAIVVAWLAALTCSDLRHRRLPNSLTLTGAAVVLLMAAAAGRGLPALAGAVALAGAYLAVHLRAPAGMGAGDVKLAVGLGGLTGAFGTLPWVLAAIGAPLLTVMFAVLLRRRVLPHGPAMCVASALALLPVFGGP
jgi:leader peptidase (prepilin peptidase) / N-methyltransferase